MPLKEMTRDEILTTLYFEMYKASGVYRVHPWPYKNTLDPFLDVYGKEENDGA